MKKLKFHPDLVPLVRSGSKTTTWRLFDDKNIQMGDELTLINSKTIGEFARGKVVLVNETIFGNLTPEDWAGQEEFSALEEMYKTYSKFYNCVVNENTILKISKFRLK